VKQLYYPNPVENILNLQLSEEQNQVMLTDVLGQKQFEATVKSNAKIDMTSLKSGIYFLRVKNIQGGEIKKIIKR
jgi:predicted RNA-binding protein